MAFKHRISFVTDLAATFVCKVWGQQWDVKNWGEQWVDTNLHPSDWFSIRTKWLGACTGCLSVSASERCTLSWTQPSSGNPYACIYTPESALSLQRMVSTYHDMVLSPAPCHKLHHSDNRKTNCRPSGKQNVVHNCFKLPDLHKEVGKLNQ